MFDFRKNRGGHDSTEFFLNEFWRHDPALRTVLYYSWRIVFNDRAENDKDIRDELQRMVTLQEHDFDEAIRLLADNGILNPNTGQPRSDTGAMRLIGELAKQYFGKYLDTLDGVEIARTEKDKKLRQKIWVENGSDIFEKLFKGAENLQIYTEDLSHNKGRILIFDAGLFLPFMLVYFVNTSRLTSTDEVTYLARRVQIIADSRRSEIIQRGLEGDDLNNALMYGITGIPVIAAPTYSETVAKECYSGDLPTPLIGPINLAAIAQYLSIPENRKCLWDQYLELLWFISPWGEGIKRGIIFSDWLIEHLVKAKESCLQRE